MLVLKKIKNHFSTHSFQYLAFAIGLVFANVAFCDPASDPLASTVLPQVQALFSPTSTVAYCIYVAEVLLASIAYVKTKSPLTLLGIPILMIFTHAMFTYIAPTS